MQFSTTVLAAVAIFAGQTLAACSPHTTVQNHFGGVCQPSGNGYQCGDATISDTLNRFVLQTSDTYIGLQAVCRTPNGHGGENTQMVNLYCDPHSTGIITLKCLEENLTLSYFFKGEN
ncbi:hypothetical protein E4U42_003768 [Claviceps africana]|uniref:Cyanovirin-N domain-containing protein n=1 Tax=Claviceps africana TaxID=83212 RepID=A0A8K0JC70_9HYPO|nr:hypothetical protein E4U42_003768 [Claviceps africana]